MHTTETVLYLDLKTDIDAFYDAKLKFYDGIKTPLSRCCDNAGLRSKSGEKNICISFLCLRRSLRAKTVINSVEITN